MSELSPAEYIRLKEQLKTRIERLDRGESIQLDDEEALRVFFDDIQARGMQRYKNRQAPNRRS